ERAPTAGPELRLWAELLVGWVGEAVMGALGAAVSISQVQEAGAGSALPAASIAKTVNVCDPSATPVYVFGEVQLTAAEPSSEHMKLAPASELNENVAVDEFDGFVGPS